VEKYVRTGENPDDNLIRGKVLLEMILGSRPEECLALREGR